MSNVSTRLKKAAVIALSVSTLSSAMVVGSGASEARWRNRGAGIGLGIVGGLAAGGLIAGATRPAYADGYYSSGYSGGGYYEAPRAYAYEDRPVCHIERQRVYLDEYTYRTRKVRVCD